MSKKEGEGALVSPLDGRSQGKQRLLDGAGPGLRPGERACGMESQEKGGTQRPHQKRAPRHIQTRGPPRPAVGHWPRFVCGHAAPAAIIREHQVPGEVDNLNMEICLLI